MSLACMKAAFAVFRKWACDFLIFPLRSASIWMSKVRHEPVVVRTVRRDLWYGVVSRLTRGPAGGTDADIMLPAASGPPWREKRHETW